MGRLWLHPYIKDKHWNIIRLTVNLQWTLFLMDKRHFFSGVIPTFTCPSVHLTNNWLISSGLLWITETPFTSLSSSPTCTKPVKSVHAGWAGRNINDVQRDFSVLPGSVGFSICILRSALLLDPQIRAASVLGCDLFICSHNNATKEHERREVDIFLPQDRSTEPTILYWWAFFHHLTARKKDYSLLTFIL